MKKIIKLKKRKATPFLYRHPWVFSGAIADVSDGIEDGDQVALVGNDGDFIAWGLYNSRSQIRVRLYSWKEEETIDPQFWNKKIESALALRREHLRLWNPGGACRLVFSEGDGISGLIADYYAGYLVLQVNSLALFKRLDLLIESLAVLCRPKGIFLKNEKEINDQEGIICNNGPVWGDMHDEDIVIDENGISFAVQIREGQKTGFYLDHRDNRRASSAFSAGKRVLDVCCYTGGFSLNAAKAGAKEVVGVDISSPTIEIAKKNASINSMGNIEFIRSDSFRFLADLSASEKFGVIIIDPPRFAQSSRTINRAIQGYTDLNRLAVRALEKNGTLITCSCSGRVTSEQFMKAVQEAGKENGRMIQLIEERGQAPDHPVSLSCPETKYLKCLICRVE